MFGCKTLEKTLGALRQSLANDFTSNMVKLIAYVFTIGLHQTYNKNRPNVLRPNRFAVLVHVFVTIIGELIKLKL
jgi:hypothetical protein